MSHDDHCVNIFHVHVLDLAQMSHKIKEAMGHNAALARTNNHPSRDVPKGKDFFIDKPLTYFTGFKQKHIWLWLPEKNPLSLPPDE